MRNNKSSCQALSLCLNNELLDPLSISALGGACCHGDDYQTIITYIHVSTENINMDTLTLTSGPQSRKL